MPLNSFGQDVFPKGDEGMSPTFILLGILILGIVGNQILSQRQPGSLLVIQFTNYQTCYLYWKTGPGIGAVVFGVGGTRSLLPAGPGKEVFRSFVSVSGLIAIISGALATHLNGHGLELLQREPYLMIGLVIGSIVGVIFFGGIPVGPLMAGGIAAILLSIANLMR